MFVSLHVLVLCSCCWQTAHLLVLLRARLHDGLVQLHHPLAVQLLPPALQDLAPLLQQLAQPRRHQGPPRNRSCCRILQGRRAACCTCGARVRGDVGAHMHQAPCALAHVAERIHSKATPLSKHTTHAHNHNAHDTNTHPTFPWAWTGSWAAVSLPVTCCAHCAACHMLRALRCLSHAVRTALPVTCCAHCAACHMLRMVAKHTRPAGAHTRGRQPHKASRLLSMGMVQQAARHGHMVQQPAQRASLTSGVRYD